jgi:hypothetical protein
MCSRGKEKKHGTSFLNNNCILNRDKDKLSAGMNLLFYTKELFYLLVMDHLTESEYNQLLILLVECIDQVIQFLGSN